MILCMDAAYVNTEGAACGVVFPAADSSTPFKTYNAILDSVAAYVPGNFYLRELPLLIRVVEKVSEDLDLVIIDGYVWLPGGRFGLGAHLFNVFDERFPVIGIAKSLFKGHSSCEKVLRGRSRRPLYVTAAGIKCREAADTVRKMYGSFRIPEMMRIADKGARSLIRIAGTDAEAEDG